MMDFKNPLGQCQLWHTPSHEELEKYLEKFNGSERIVAVTIYGMTMNMCAAHVDGAIKEQEVLEEELLLTDGRLMHMDMETNW